MLNFLFATIIFVIVILLALTLMSRNIFGRTLAVNVLGTVIALLIALISVVSHEPDYMDIALLYLLLNFSTTLTLLRFFKSGDIPARLLKGIIRSDRREPPNQNDGQRQAYGSAD